MLVNESAVSESEETYTKGHRKENCYEELVGRKVLVKKHKFRAW